ncbi:MULTISPECIES: hypothetical protein [Pseudomonas]|uniref:Uncharacterized protein n=1 Tax=Pseudomonas kuykendallii TaxID=1007099 RepID=A0A2W5F2G8_9PSED|nr:MULTISPECIES: hypothetical protein [Pseudomonas]PZP26586.1 MAG: hypothetical protein DI599_00050 [Pseudomonas kuykendallii]
MTEKELLAALTRLIATDDLPDFTPSVTGALLFETLLDNWDELSPAVRGQLMLVLGILTRELSAESKAERTTAQILERLTRR